MPERKKKYAFILMAMANTDPSLVDVHIGLKRVCKKLSIIAERVDDIELVGRITDKILDCIDRADIIIADLTHERPNVYYELGYCHGMGKRVVLIAHEGTSLHFDIKDFRVLFYKNVTELENKLEPTLRTIMDRRVVGDYMDRDISRISLTGRERGSIYLERLRQGEEDAYVVVGEGRELRGVLTPSDVRVKRPIYEASPEVEVEKIMTESPCSVRDDDTVEHALELMDSKGIITGLPVVNSRNRVVGYVTRQKALMICHR